jgi:DNA segregation ATPase FtsK/SpoIIIE, S-DNA-T family
MAHPLPKDGDAMGDVVRLPLPEPPLDHPAGGLARSASTAVEPAPPVFDAEALTNEQYQRAKAARWASAVLPARWQDADELRRVREVLGRRAVRGPLEYPKAVGRGGMIACRAWWRWVSVADFYAAAKAANQLAHKFDDVHRHRARRRWWTLGTLSTASAGVLIADLIEGPISLWIAGGLVSVALAVAGRRRDGNGRAAVIRPRSISWAMDGNNLVTAFRDAKLIGKDEGLAFVQLPKREGDGWAVVVDLPPSRKASTVIAKKEELASALAVDEMQLIAERVRGKGGHAGRLSLWIADDDPYAAVSVLSPLAEAEAWDFWQPAPFGTTPRGRTVCLPMVWTSLLVGAIPRMGKTYVMRIPVTAAALDPYVRLIAADGKGGKDHRPYALVAHRYIPNALPESNRRLIAVLEEVAVDVVDRFGRLAEMDDEICPESKLTPQISRDPEHDMPLTVISIDEIQNYLEDDTPLDPDDPKNKKTVGKRILELLTFIAKTGPAAGFVLILATQKPDGQVIPDTLRGQIGTRFALKVMTWQASETILGAGTYKAGMDASKLLKSHKGVGLLLGADGETELDAGEAITLKTHLLEIKAIRAACQRGRALREQAGTLTGDAAGDTTIGELSPEVAARIEQENARVAAEASPAGPTQASNGGRAGSAVEIVDAEIVPDELPEVLARLVDVIEDHEHGVRATAELAERIGWEAKTLGEALRAAGVPRPSPDKQRVPGGKPYPVPVQDLEAIRTAVIAYYDGADVRT